MEKTGLSDSVLVQLTRCNITGEQVHRTAEMDLHIAEEKMLQKTILVIGKSKSIFEIVNCERMLIENDINRIKAGSAYLGTITSLETAQNDLANSLKSLAKVQDINDYKSFNEGISEKKIDRVNGLPRDAFHRFIDSNITRINNSIISPKVPVYEKNILTERKANMKIAKEEYMKLQAIALEIKLQEKSKEHER